jgi:hypothetical protein
MRKRGSFGLVLLVVAMAIVLLLAAKNWQAAAPRLSETMRAAPRAEALVGEDGDGSARGERRLPTVPEMKRATDRHAAEVQEALGEAR